MMEGSHKLKIMLVEDDINDIELTKIVLKRRFSEDDLYLVTDGPEALECLERLNGSDLGLPDLILLDVGLPKMSGLELLKRLKEDSRFGHIPVLILTGSLVNEHIQKSYDLGAITYLIKPISEDDLMVALEYIV